jgi:hypothetical protein
MWQYPLLDRETGLPNGQVFQTRKSPQEIETYAAACSWSALELRALTQAGVDLHAETAKRIWETPPANAQEAKARRQAGQLANFSALYGGRSRAKL